ncbi:MAG TPA: ATP-binding cassette domain-containing protein, partial [bacterium]|nr:ATP-binding cassette domain-containing protein [bacterium]
MIKFDHVTKVYKGSIEAVKEVTFTVDDGEFFVVVGPSGAGKSTLVRLLVRQEIPSEGEIIFRDIDITQI